MNAHQRRKSRRELIPAGYVEKHVPHMTGCRGCAYHAMSAAVCGSVRCQPWERDDGKAVIFVKK